LLLSEIRGVVPGFKRMAAGDKAFLRQEGTFQSRKGDTCKVDSYVWVEGSRIGCQRQHGFLPLSRIAFLDLLSIVCQEK
jgi:hypothetical protein